VQGAKAIQASFSADSNLLAYFALHRLGKVEEAESYLCGQTAAFRGNPDEHLFLLSLAGRLTDCGWRPDSGRDRYYNALSDLQSGNTKNAMALLQEEVAKTDKDNLLRLAAQIELKWLRIPNPR